MEFKVGDKVRILGGTEQREWNTRAMKETIGTVGKITKIDTEIPEYRVTFEDEEWWDYNEEDLEKVEDPIDLIKPSYLLILEDGRKAKTLEIQSGTAIQYGTKGGWDELRVVIDKVQKIYGLCRYGARVCEFSEEDRPLIWEKKSPTQIKLEELENEQRQIADKIAELRNQLNQLDKND